MVQLHVTNVKMFMNKLLASEAFDSFLLEEATIMTANTYTINGHINREFFADIDTLQEELPTYEFAKWSDMKVTVFQLIKGKRTPLQIKMVLQLKPESVAAVLKMGDTTVTADDIKSFVVTIRFDQNGCKVVTAVSYRNFVLDKTPDKLWDQEMKKFLTRKEIVFEDETI